MLFCAKRHLSRFLILLLLVSEVLYGGCTNTPSPYVRLQVPLVKDKNADMPANNGQLRVALAPVIIPRENLDDFKVIFHYLSRELNMPIELVRVQTYAEINELMKFKEIDLALTCSYPYIIGKKDFGMELLAFPQVKGKIAHSSLIIVHRDNTAHSLIDLRGKSFAFSDPLSFSGHLWPLYAITLAGYDPRTFFQRTTFTYSHDNSIKAVASKLVDGAAIDSVVFDYWLEKHPEYKNKIKVIERSEEMDVLPLVISPYLPEPMKERIQRAFLEMDQKPAGQQALRAVKIDRFVLPDDTAYDPMRRMLQRMTAQ